VPPPVVALFCRANRAERCPVSGGNVLQNYFHDQNEQY
jgi:hypothetical protein